MSDAVLRRADDDRGVVTLRIDAPATRNALGSELLERLGEELEAVGRDTQVRAVVLTASGRIFSSGADRRELIGAGDVVHVTNLLTDVLERIDALPVPVVCRVNGDAYGAGLALLATADISISVADASFALPEARFGMAATVAAAACVPRLGEAAALDLLLTGRPFGAEEAHRRGLLTAVVDEADLDEAVEARIGDILVGAPSALAVSKQLARRLGAPSLHERLNLASVLGRGVDADEAGEGLEAMAARRPPSWVAREGS